MNRLLQEARDVAMIGARRSRVVKHPNEDVLLYRAIDGTKFFIDTRPVNHGGDPVVTSPSARNLGPYHVFHTLPNGRVDLCGRLSQACLSDILAWCDYWAARVAYYRQTGAFIDEVPRQEATNPFSQFWKKVKQKFCNHWSGRGLTVNKDVRTQTV